MFRFLSSVFSPLRLTYFHNGFTLRSQPALVSLHLPGRYTAEPGDAQGAARAQRESDRRRVASGSLLLGQDLVGNRRRGQVSPLLVSLAGVAHVSVGGYGAVVCCNCWCGLFGPFCYSTLALAVAPMIVVFSK